MAANLSRPQCVLSSDMDDWSLSVKGPCYHNKSPPPDWKAQHSVCKQNRDVAVTSQSPHPYLNRVALCREGSETGNKGVYAVISLAVSLEKWPCIMIEKTHTDKVSDNSQFDKDVKPGLAKAPLNFIGGLIKLWFTSLVK